MRAITKTEAERAYDEWGCNYGPAAALIIVGLSVGAAAWMMGRQRFVVAVINSVVGGALILAVLLAIHVAEIIMLPGVG